MTVDDRSSDGGSSVMALIHIRYRSSRMAPVVPYLDLQDVRLSVLSKMEIEDRGWRWRLKTVIEDENEDRGRRP
jgi:hypothetical protein